MTLYRLYPLGCTRGPTEVLPRPYRGPCSGPCGRPARARKRSVNATKCLPTRVAHAAAILKLEVSLLQLHHGHEDWPWDIDIKVNH
jgi:hypothetical protein